MLLFGDLRTQVIDFSPHYRDSFFAIKLNCNVVRGSMLWKYTVLTISVCLSVSVLHVRISGGILAPDNLSGCSGLINILFF
jgi:hypothetical protein